MGGSASARPAPAGNRASMRRCAAGWRRRVRGGLEIGVEQMDCEGPLKRGIGGLSNSDDWGRRAGLNAWPGAKEGHGFGLDG